MEESQPARIAAGIAAARAAVEGGVYGIKTADDRGYLLRRESRFPFPQMRNSTGDINLRRARRVSAPFSGIRPLARSAPPLRRRADRP